MLDEIVERTKERIEMEKSIIPLEELKKQTDLLDVNDEFPFKKALKTDDVSIIAEIKKATPFNGLICEDFDYIQIAKDCQEAGVCAISVCTEPYFFKGDDDYLKEIAQSVSVPLIRNDFIIDEYMIYQAKYLGASAILLIVSILDIVQLKKFIDLAHSLGLSAIVECHDGDEIMRALTVGAEIVCVSNRDMGDFSEDIENSISLRRCVSGDVVFISEGGIKTKEDITRLNENDVDAVLIGETLMKSDDKKATIFELRN